jgi:hypothetical protein
MHVAVIFSNRQARHIPAITTTGKTNPVDAGVAFRGPTTTRMQGLQDMPVDHRRPYLAALRTPRTRNACLALLLLFTQACGGGGGGDSLKIKLVTKSLAWSYFPDAGCLWR